MSISEANVTLESTIHAPISSSLRTAAPPGCMFTNFERLYTFASMMTHYTSTIQEVPGRRREVDRKWFRKW